MPCKTTLFRPVRAEGLDLDSNKHLNLFKVIYNSQIIGKTGIRVMRSPSGRGYHVYCDQGFTKEEAALLGDCKGRIRYWEDQGYTFTFQNRHNSSGTIVGVEIPYNPLSFAFWRVPR